MSPYGGRDCVKSLRAFYTGAYSRMNGPASIGPASGGESEFFIDNLLVRIHLIIEMIWWTGLAPWAFEFPFPGSLTSTFLVRWG